MCALFAGQKHRFAPPGMRLSIAATLCKNEHEDAETTPLRNPEEFRFDLDLAEIAEVWRRGSVIASWLLDLTVSGLSGDPQLENFNGRVSDSGEGRWTIKAAVDAGVPVPVLSTAIYSRFASRGRAEFADKLLSAMRLEFGGVDVDALAAKLQDEGTAAFVKSCNELMDVIASRSREMTIEK